MELIYRIVAAVEEHNQRGISRPPNTNDDVSGMCMFINELRKNGYIIKGFAHADPNSDRPIIRRDPITDTYEIRMDIQHSGDERKRNFAIAVLAILKGPIFISEVYDKLSCIDDLFLEQSDLLVYYKKILSVL